MNRIIIAAALASALTVSAAAQDAAAPAPATPAAPVLPAAPSDPLTVATAALEKARADQCRYAFSVVSESSAQVALGDGEVAAKFRFDPRGALGSRWTLVSANKRAKQMEKMLGKIDAQGIPSDLTSLAPEGEMRLENLTVSKTDGEVMVATFRPAPDPVRMPNEINRNVVAQMQGELEFKADGSLVRRTVRVPEAGIKVGMAKLQAGSTSRQFMVLDGGHVVTESEVQNSRASALLTSASIITTTRYSDVEAVCDAQVVAEIAAREKAAQSAGAK